MSLADLAAAVADSSDEKLRNGIDALRAASTPPQPVLTNAQWAELVPMYKLIVETMIANSDAALFRGIINQIQAMNGGTALAVIVAQVQAILDANPLIPVVDGWPPSTGGASDPEFEDIVTILEG